MSWGNSHLDHCIIPQLRPGVISLQRPCVQHRIEATGISSEAHGYHLPELLLRTPGVSRASVSGNQGGERNNSWFSTLPQQLLELPLRSGGRGDKIRGPRSGACSVLELARQGVRLHRGVERGRWCGRREQAAQGFHLVDSSLRTPVVQQHVRGRHPGIAVKRKNESFRGIHVTALDKTRSLRSSCNRIIFAPGSGKLLHDVHPLLRSRKISTIQELLHQR
mmetsp:Transcript_84816/g.226706  ORF Transcript_84816/g.226706 Transcript_84816/m.226706 type:complete len:221 (-) Transcript_84816:560-1222(-)